MQTRTAFNGGEQAPAAGARYDMDAFMRGCRVLENWDLSAIGGVKRRRGMRQFAPMTQASESTIGEREAKLVPFIYSFSERSAGRYLVSISPGRVRVFNRAGDTVADFISSTYNPAGDSDDEADWYIDPETINIQQLNSILIITSSANPPLQLKCDAEEQWTLTEYKFSSPPWRHEKEKRDKALKVTASLDSGSMEVTYNVDFSAVTDTKEKEIDAGDLLRISFWLDQQEAKQNGATARAGISIRSDLPMDTKKGTRFCVPSETDVTYWICTQEWPGTVYAEGLELPSNYPDNFEKAVDTSSYGDAPVHWSVHDVTGGTIQKNTKFGIKSGYWKYYTCIKDFGAGDFVPGLASYDDYPDFFRPGIILGDALACQGQWEFWCSGTWYGEYAVCRNYEKRSWYDDGWETAGRSKSYNEAATNEHVTGDESAEPCYLRLVLLQSRRVSEEDIESGWPPDSCGNRLIVKGFQYSQTLQASIVTNTEGTASVNWTCPDKVQSDWYGQRTVSVWSWQAFCDKYGYPRLCALFGQRLIFAATNDQPQTVWMSQVDDFANFHTHNNDDSAIAITLATTTQNPICWMMERRDVLMLGTSDREYVLMSHNGAAITKDSLQRTMHGNIGSANVNALEAEDKVLFVERGGGRIFQYGYNYEIDGYRSTDLTILASHLLKNNGGVVDAACIAKPERQAVFVAGNGQLILCAYQESQQVNAWHRWVTDGKILSVCAMPDGTNNDRIFLLVERTVPNADGETGWEEQTVLNIEVIDEESTYQDNFGTDYTSTLITNSMFNAMERPVNKGLRREIAYNFLGDVPLKNMLFTSDGGENWARAAREADVLPGGWHKLGTLNNWEYETAVGVKVCGNNPLTLLCLQG